MKFVSTKRTLVASVLLLALCFSAFVGTTFAWFTDEAKSSGNLIQSGTLDIAFEKWDTENNKWVNAEGTKIFDYDKWEPGYTQIVNLRVTNLGTLALKWQAIINTQKELSALADVINVYVRSDDQNDTVRQYIDTVDRFGFEEEAAAGNFKKFTLRYFVENLTAMTYGKLAAGKSAYLGLVLQMDTDAGNEYQGLDLGGYFDLTILATQDTVENDSFGNPNYDAAAQFYGSTTHPAPEAGESAIEVDVVNDKMEVIGTVVVTTNGMADKNAETIVNINKSNHTPNITVGINETKVTFDLSVSNLDGTTPAKVSLFVGEGLDPATVKVYHYCDSNGDGVYADELVASDYTPHDGYVTFSSATFSPFTLVYDETSVYVPPVVDEEDKENNVPVANVVYASEYVNTDLPWGSYGAWSPTEGLDSQLEAAYVFSCQDTLLEAQASEFANWYCDFYVVLNKDLGENEIFLGGNYGTFGWVGFHNGDLTLEANTEIPLLGSVTSNPWTYTDVVQNVGTFICGVGDVDDALAGATFTVMLRLTNPEDANDFVNVATINYTFE